MAASSFDKIFYNCCFFFDVCSSVDAFVCARFVEIVSPRKEKVGAGLISWREEAFCRFTNDMGIDEAMPS
jgi:hypothetical protein